MEFHCKDSIKSTQKIISAPLKPSPHMSKGAKTPIWGFDKRWCYSNLINFPNFAHTKSVTGNAIFSYHSILVYSGCNHSFYSFQLRLHIFTCTLFRHTLPTGATMSAHHDATRGLLGQKGRYQKRLIYNIGCGNTNNPAYAHCQYHQRSLPHMQRTWRND